MVRAIRRPKAFTVHLDEGQQMDRVRKPAVWVLLLLAAGHVLAAGKSYTVETRHYRVTTDIDRAFSDVVAQQRDNGVTQQQALATFPQATCEEAAQLGSAIPPAECVDCMQSIVNDVYAGP